MTPHDFWPDYQARCRQCGRSTAYSQAKADGWKELEALPDLPARSGAEPAMPGTPADALCWRCDRENRASETPPPPRKRPGPTEQPRPKPPQEQG